MTGRAQLMWDDAVTGYDFGSSHPMDPVRLALTRELVRAYGLDREVDVVSAPPAGRSTLGLVHHEAYIDAVRRCSADPRSADGSYGIGTVDDPAFAGMHEASALIAGQSVGAAEAVARRGAARRELRRRPAPRDARLGVGLLHLQRRVARDRAAPGAGCGACRLRRRGRAPRGRRPGGVLGRPARPDDLTARASPHALPADRLAGGDGEGEGEGSAVNLPLPAGTGDEGWLRAFHSVVPELLADFRPQALVTQHGADTHFEDPLAHLAVSLDAQRAVQASCHELAHEYVDGGRWVALGGGGYSVVDVVPRSWTHLVSIAAHAPIDPESAVPEEWREEVYARTRESAPRRMTDGRTPNWQAWDEGYDPADRLDQAILATRRAVFPLRGLLA